MANRYSWFSRASQVDWLVFFFYWLISYVTQGCELFSQRDGLVSRPDTKKD